MKKNQILLLVLSIDSILFFVFLIAWLFGGSDVGNEVDGWILILSYIIPVILFGPLVLLTKRLSSQQKGKWLVYIILISFIGSFHFYIRYKNDINQIASEADQKMKNGPKSLGEFDSRSN